ncbi:ATP12 family chaperone protein [Palleronia sp. KMU-117]|uniref:ATP12 family chaperone protein n=1 Tax=Palleronia sp. KMU-117 TaxID=3434108 RepID=UPI003D759AB8
MAEWAPKRFWTMAATVARDGGFGIVLDGRVVRTPDRRDLVVPTNALAEAIAAEWNAQGEVLVPTSMPMTRMANTAIDRVADRHGEVAAYVAGYGATDLLCYRAEGPGLLAARQATAWDPLLDWVAKTFGARLVSTVGVMPVAQPPAALDPLRRAVEDFDAFGLTGLHDLVTLSGSLVLGLAVARGHLDAEDAWARSRLDEDWQVEQWGHDDEAEIAAGNRRDAFLSAESFIRSAQNLT